MLPIKTSAQSKPFSRFYNLINGNEYGAKLLLDDKGYFLLTNGICDPGTGNSKGCTSTLTLDEEGEVSNNHTFVNWLMFASNNAIQEINDTIYIYGRDYVKKEKIWYLYMANFEGDSIELFTYTFDDFESNTIVAAEAMQIKDDYIYLLGRTLSIVPWEQIIVLKIDKRGNKIKEERFHSIANPYQINTAFDMVKTVDGNFVISGRSISKHDDHRNIEPFIIKFDENLDTLWSKRLNRVSELSNEPHLTALHDGSVVVSWGLFSGDLSEKLRTLHKIHERYPSMLYNIDKDGDIVWSDTLWSKAIKGSLGPQKRIIKMITADNGDIIGCGSYYESYIRRKWGWIFRYSPEGNMVWEKKYEYKKYPNSKSAFFDLKEADNGDIVCTGELDINEGWRGNDSYTWLLRVDSMGCFEKGCCPIDTIQLITVDSIMTTDTLSDVSLDIIVKPNPTSNRINVLLPDICAINYGGESSGITWQIFDRVGRKVKSGAKFQRVKNFYISVLDLPKGLYFLKVKDRGRNMVSVKKIVVE